MTKPKSYEKCKKCNVIMMVACWLITGARMRVRE